jgi:hypothetical protein
MNKYLKFGLAVYLTYEVILFILGIPLMIKVYQTTLAGFN